jgi:hypothetical protein
MNMASSQETSIVVSPCLGRPIRLRLELVYVNTLLLPDLELAILRDLAIALVIRN